MENWIISRKLYRGILTNVQDYIKLMLRERKYKF